MALVIIILEYNILLIHIVCEKLILFIFAVEVSLL